MKKVSTKDDDESKKKAKSDRKKDGKVKDGDGGWETVKKGTVIPTVSHKSNYEHSIGSYF